MTHNEREKHIFNLIDDGNWDSAIEHAKAIPTHHDIWQRLPTATESGMPDHAINKVIDHLDDNNINSSGFMFELTHNLQGHNQAPALQRIAKYINDKQDGSYTEMNNVLKHPNFKHTDDDEKLKAPGEFWKSYERRVEPHHFAAIKSLYSGKPEKISHRNKEGSSDGFYIADSYIYDLTPAAAVHSFDKPKMYGGAYVAKMDHIMPHLRDYASKMQDKVMKDDNIHKRYLNGKAYIKVHRGIGGQYSKEIRDAAGYHPATQEYDHKSLTVPVAPFSSWTTDPEMADRFATGRGHTLDMPDHGTVISKWMPVSDILHSGNHTVVPGQTGVHPTEQEIVFGHPTGKMKVHTKELKFENKMQNGDAFKSGIKRDKMQKNIKDAGLALATATAMMGVPQQLSTSDNVLDNDMIQYHKTQEKPTVKPLYGLKYIEMIESSGGKNLKHPEVKSGLNANTSAIGKYAIMPLQAIEIAKKDKAIAEKYPQLLSYDHVKDQDKIKNSITSNPELETELANSHWKRLYDRFNGNESKMAHAWFNGISGTTKKKYDEIAEHTYVKKYHKYKKLMQLERKPANLKKSEHDVPEEIRSITKFVYNGSSDNKSLSEVKEINDLIQMRAFHALENEGQFTSSSFVLGNLHSQSWLMKVESGSRPAIMSAKTGLQSIKEVAFYDIADRVFNLKGIVPEALLGEVDIKGTLTPTAAIKLLPKEFKLSVDMENEIPGNMFRVLEKYRKAGVLHKMAALLYILGDGDSHGKNTMTDGETLRLIDHGSSFADEKFDPSTDNNIFIPYILRVGRIKDHMEKEEKLENMPKIDSLDVKKDVKAWLLSINSDMLEDKLNNYDIDPSAVMGRLKKLQSLVVNTEEIDNTINGVWL